MLPRTFIYAEHVRPIRSGRGRVVGVRRSQWCAHVGHGERGSGASVTPARVTSRVWPLSTLHAGPTVLGPAPSSSHSLSPWSCAAARSFHSPLDAPCDIFPGILTMHCARPMFESPRSSDRRTTTRHAGRRAH
jgi:hypothetical protein